MDRDNAVARNPRLLFWGRLLLETKTTAALMVLFYLHRGITLGDVFRLSVVWSLTSLIAEVPSGYLADRIGRRPTLMLGAAFMLVGLVQMMLAHGFFGFALMIALMSISNACLSGTEESMLYDSLCDQNLEHDMVGQSGKLTSARFAAKMFLPLLGSFVARDLLEWQFRMLIGLDIAFALLAILVLSKLKEPSCRTGSVGIRMDIFRQSLRTIRNQPWLLKAMFSKTLVFSAGLLLYRVYQPLLTGYGFPVVAIGLYYVVSRGAMFFSHRQAGAAVRVFGPSRVIMWTAIVGASLVGLVLCLDLPWAVFVVLCLAEVAIGFREPPFSLAIHDRIASCCRATAVSNLNCLKCVVDIPLMLLAGRLSELSVDYLLAMAILLCVFALVVFPMRRQDFDN